LVNCFSARIGNVVTFSAASDNGAYPPITITVPGGETTDFTSPVGQPNSGSSLYVNDDFPAQWIGYIDTKCYDASANKLDFSGAANWHCAWSFSHIWRECTPEYAVQQPFLCQSQDYLHWIAAALTNSGRYEFNSSSASSPAWCVYTDWQNLNDVINNEGGPCGYRRGRDRLVLIVSQ
jgi:hypothetical protein